ncbi:hypothetical protein RclHR1_04570010 [Rhizophagus clarus]|uniref:Uncharacterized protein n=1 Tax=Rhizophagus clarus TaxID=94130 RepID=A0A2Z6RN19_9GLOM|nr:hypothetical protein RclHR1_04570010 [Rhizophagus clarus]
MCGQVMPAMKRLDQVIPVHSSKWGWPLTERLLYKYVLRKLRDTSYTFDIGLNSVIHSENLSSATHSEAYPKNSLSTTHSEVHPENSSFVTYFEIQNEMITLNEKNISSITWYSW